MLKIHENISLHPISTLPPEGKLIPVFYMMNKNELQFASVNRALGSFIVVAKVFFSLGRRTRSTRTHLTKSGWKSSQQTNQPTDSSTDNLLQWLSGTQSAWRDWLGLKVRTYCGTVLGLSKMLSEPVSPLPLAIWCVFPMKAQMIKNNCTLHPVFLLKWQLPCNKVNVMILLTIWRPDTNFSIVS